MQKPTHYQKMVHATSHSSIIWQIRDSTANTPAVMSTSAAGCHPPPTVHLCAYNLLKIGLLICKTSNADKTGLHFKNISALWGKWEITKKCRSLKQCRSKNNFFLLTIDHSFKPAEQDLRGTISKLTALVWKCQMLVRRSKRHNQESSQPE